MKIKIEEWIDEDEYQNEILFINDIKEREFHPLIKTPDLAILEKEVTSAGDIAYLMEKAYNAGKNGEDFNIEFIDISKK